MLKNQFIFSNNEESLIKFNEKFKIKIVTNQKDLETFYRVPWTIYKNDVNWVPPLWIETRNFFKINNPFWLHANARLFIAYKDQKIIGRIAAIIDNLYCKETNKKIGFFGFFECIDNYECAKALFDVSKNWLVSNDIKMMQGPINGRIDNGCGFLYEGFNFPPSILSIYSPKYYIKFAEQYNMKKVRDQIGYNIDLTKPLPEKLEGKAKECEKSGVKIRKFNRIRTNEEIKWWINLFLDTFKDHWGYIPVSPDEVKSRFGVKQLRWIVDPNLFLIAEINNQPVAYIWANPDFNQLFKKLNGKIRIYNIIDFLKIKSQINRGILSLIGIKKNLRNHSIGSLLNYKVLLEMKNRGYQNAEVGWIDEKNRRAHSTISITGAKPFKKFRVFEKIIK